MPRWRRTAFLMIGRRASMPVRRLASRIGRARPDLRAISDVSRNPYVPQGSLTKRIHRFSRPAH